MPIYEYICIECQNEFEKLVLNASSQINCPRCKAKNIQKKFSLFAFKNNNTFKSSSNNSSCGSCVSKNCASCG